MTPPTPISSSTAAPPPESLNIDSDLVVILAALLCALICVIGLVAVARCAWLRRFTTRNAPNNPPLPPQLPANKGLKKKVLRSLPKQKFSTAETDGKLADCVICLAEFADGDEIRILPQCGHGFHLTCIDTWLGAHSSCPSCRQILVATRCKNCGGVESSSGGGGVGCGSSSGGLAEMEAGLKAREDDVNRFLP